MFFEVNGVNSQDHISCGINLLLSFDKKRPIGVKRDKNYSDISFIFQPVNYWLLFALSQCDVVWHMSHEYVLFVDSYASSFFSLRISLQVIIIYQIFILNLFGKKPNNWCERDYVEHRQEKSIFYAVNSEKHYNIVVKFNCALQCICAAQVVIYMHFKTKSIAE